MMGIRNMRREDLPEVSEIEQAVFSDPWSLRAFEEEIRNPDAVYLVCEAEGKIAGYCGLWCVVGEGQITNVAVGEGYRGKGIGTGMLLKLLEKGREKGLSAFTLEVRVSNAAAVRLYEKLGFTSVGIRKSFYEKPVEDAFIMWLYDSVRISDDCS